MATYTETMTGGAIGGGSAVVFTPSGNNTYDEIGSGGCRCGGSAVVAKYSPHNSNAQCGCCSGRFGFRRNVSGAYYPNEVPLSISTDFGTFYPFFFNPATTYGENGYWCSPDCQSIGTTPNGQCGAGFAYSNAAPDPSALFGVTVPDPRTTTFASIGRISYVGPWTGSEATLTAQGPFNFGTLPDGFPTTIHAEANDFFQFPCNYWCQSYVVIAATDHLVAGGGGFAKGRYTVVESIGSGFCAFDRGGFLWIDERIPINNQGFGGTFPKTGFFLSVTNEQGLLEYGTLASNDGFGAPCTGVVSDYPCSFTASLSWEFHWNCGCASKVSDDITIYPVKEGPLSL
jgi:hypothetical protein